MSTVGVGAAVLIPVAGVAALGAVVVGAGVLIGQGVMWCGKKLEENYQNACHEWTDMVAQSQRASRANVEEMSTCMMTQLEYLSASAYLTQVAPSATKATAIDRKALSDLIAQTQAVISDANQMAARTTTSEKALLIARLQSEIRAGQGILPDSLVKQAEQTLQGTQADMSAMLEKLEEAWQAISLLEARKSRSINQAQQLILSVSTQLNAIETLLPADKIRDATFVARKTSIEDNVMKARDLLAVHPEQALEIIKQAQQETKSLVEVASTIALDRWDTNRKRLNGHLGTLKALSSIIEDLEQTQLVDRPRLNQLTQRLNAAQQGAKSLAEGVTEQRLTLFERQIAILKDDIFGEVTKSQQQRTAQIIQSTLNELGFQSDVSGPATLRNVGNTIHVDTVISRGTPEQRDDKMVSFVVSRDAQVSYDFSGYIGESCLKDAKKVFDALKANGVYIMDNEDLDKMKVRLVTEETLQQAQFQPTLVQNKSQAELAEVVQGVLKQMGYTNLHQRVVGGSIEMEAFKGSKGYSVVLPPDGEAQIFKDVARTEISGNLQDPLVAEVKSVQEAAQEEMEKPRKRSHMMKSRRQQMLGH